MLSQKTYYCGICKITFDTISHHKSHIKTQKHRNNRKLFELALSKLTNEELEETYKMHNITDVLREIETILYTPNDNPIKLNQPNCNTINITEYMSAQKNTMIQETNSVSNKEALKDKIHEIHNYLRNNGAGYGMNALKVFNIIYGLKKIEENGLFDKINLKKPECQFSHLLSLANENKDEYLAELIFGTVLTSINDSGLKELLFYEIPQNIKGSVFAYLIKGIDKITIIEKTCNVLLSGKIYEYFIGRDESAISELGAYFTDRHITNYCLQKADPTTNEDGTIPSMIDMFGGSGGFTTEYITYLNEKYHHLIDWTTEINKIHHYDMNEDVIKSAGLEFFCLTGVLPNMDHLKYKNSFTDEFNREKYHYIFTNPPYGGDKSSKTEAQSKRVKVKEYIKNELLTITDEDLRIKRQKQLKNIEAQEKQEKKEQNKAKVCIGSCSARIQKFAKDNKLKGNDKESCSLMLMMDTLEVGGTAVGVLKEGVFFNKTYKDLRRCLVENFNVREVISVPQDQFENTSTKTSIIIFDNTEEKTNQIMFRDLVVEKYTGDKFAEVFGDIVIVENKGDIKGVSDVLVSQATREELLGNAICSLNGKDYNKNEIVVGDGYELVKLGSLCNCLTTTKHYTNIGKTEGKYKFYNSSQDSKLYVDFCEVKDYSVILGQGGNFNIHIDKNFTASKHVCVIQTNTPNETLLKFIYYIIPELQKTFIKNGSTISWLNKTNIRDFNIPIPKSPSKIQEWVDRISTPYNEKNAKQTKIKELELFVQNRIREIGENEECDEVELGSVCEIWCGKNLPKQKAINGIYNVYGGGNSSYTHNEYNLEGFNIIISRVGNNSVTLLNERFYLTDNGFSLIVNNEIKKYFGYYILNNKEQIFNVGNGSAQKVISKSQLSKLKIKIPKNKQLIQDLESTFQQIETLQNDVKTADKLYKQIIQDLSEDAIPTQTKTNIQVPTEAVVVSNEEITNVPPKKKVKKIKIINKSKATHS